MGFDAKPSPDVPFSAFRDSRRGTRAGSGGILLCHGQRFANELGRRPRNGGPGPGGDTTNAGFDRPRMGVDHG